MRYLFAFILAVSTAATAHAHAFLDHADPKVGSSGLAPNHVELWMTEELEPTFSHVHLFDAQGHEVVTKGGKISGATMVVLLPKLSPGIYRVKWSAVSVDTHHTAGTFTFTAQ